MHNDPTRSSDSRRHANSSSWLLVAAIIAAFAAGIAMIVQMWWLFWLSAGVVALTVPVGWLIRAMDDTALAAEPPDGSPQCRCPPGSHQDRVHQRLGESVIHSLMMAEIPAPLLLALLCEVNPLLLAISATGAEEAADEAHRAGITAELVSGCVAWRRLRRVRCWAAPR